MAELESTESSIATTISSTTNWWPDLHANSLSSWSSTTTTNTNQWHVQNPNSKSSCEEDVSISTSYTNASNHSGLSVDSSGRFSESAPANELIGEAASDNHLWSHVLLSVGTSGELHNSHDGRENLLDMVQPKNLSTGMFEPAFDYLKKMDNSWEFTNSSSFNNFEKQYNGFNESLIESERLSKLSNLVSNWSLAPPNPEVDHQFDHMKQTLGESLSCKEDMNRNLGSFPSYGDDMKVDNELQEVDAPAGAMFRRSYNYPNGTGYQIGLNNSIVGDNMKFYYGMPDVPCTSTATSFADVISFGNYCLSKPLMDSHAPKSNLKSLNLSDSKQQELQTSSHIQQPTISKCHTQTRNNGRGQGMTNEGKKKRTEENSADTVLKKPKQESSTVTSVKMQGPKVKLGDKITALQQIVSPFGKTDTASVLWEAINYIRCLQEQVQLLSNPYLKTNASKDSWGGLDRKERGESKLDLKSRGLCLVPISCTPQVYRENTTGSDYWTPAYRGCLYR